MFTIVIPVYKNEGSISALLEKLEGMRARVNGPLEIVFVVDGSPDQSFERLRAKLPSCSFRSQVLAHSRNFGSLAAIRTGLHAARGEYFAVMAADLQEPPELVEQMFEILRSQEVDVVVGQRASRSDPATSSAAARIFWWLYRMTINPDIPAGGVDIFGCNRLALRALLQLNESNSSMIAQLFWVGFRRRIVQYERLARAEGVSAWTFRKKVRYLLDSVFDPTGAGDCFAGGFMGYLASRNVDLADPGADHRDLHRAVIYGSVMGSFCCEKFGVERFRSLTRAKIDARFQEFQDATDF